MVQLSNPVNGGSTKVKGLPHPKGNFRNLVCFCLNQTFLLESRQIDVASTNQLSLIDTDGLVDFYAGCPLLTQPVGAGAGTGGPRVDPIHYCAKSRKVLFVMKRFHVFGDSSEYDLCTKLMIS